MDILNFIKNYWPQILFVCGFLVAIYKFAMAMIEATKCSLRNDILSIYDRCKEKEEITKYQLESIEYSYKLYKRLKGNSFIENLVSRVRKFKVVD